MNDTILLADGAVLGVFPASGEEGRTAAMLVLPGGGYARLAEHEGAPVARWLSGLGIAAFVLHYRVAPHRYAAPLLDARNALAHLRANADRLGIDAHRIGVLGFSAGGHLAGLLATDPSERPDAAVLAYPVASLLTLPHEGSVTNLLGPDPDPADLHDLSLEHRVDGDTPPTFLWHTADDASVSPMHSFLVAGALARHHVPFELHVYRTGGHGLGLAADHPAGAWTAACAAFLRDLGWC
ncbi:alpha/beta hydrolase [Thermomonospora cellulosilytica]|uniref:Acetyl esterase/lipase n=1 Tax=Thermomonospora cellulosilytica TaxID=1411118 RepID=A0A7W3MYG0_9ACTN|nr:alpha/beta hydrolase [Thermomonospora cellulosilytica]MBA9004210.1 acetyl esterase/lipase [Thermomonospora cellulosilytica]